MMPSMAPIAPFTFGVTQSQRLPDFHGEDFGRGLSTGGAMGEWDAPPADPLEVLFYHSD
jgi:hypothetical protein